MMHWVYKVGTDETTGFVCDSGRKAAEYMVYSLCVKAKRDYRIEELRFGYAITLNGEPLYWVKK